MPEPLDAALTEVRALLLDPTLTRAVAAGRRRGHRPSMVRAELRPVALKAGPRLQISTSDGSRPYTRNVAPGPEADAAVDALLAEPFGNWHVETADATLQLRVTKSGEAQVHRAAAPGPPPSRVGTTGRRSTSSIPVTRSSPRSAARRRSGARSTRSCGRWRRPSRTT